MVSWVFCSFCFRLLYEMMVGVEWLGYGCFFVCGYYWYIFVLENDLILWKVLYVNLVRRSMFVMYVCVLLNDKVCESWKFFIGF